MTDNQVHISDTVSTKTNFSIDLIKWPFLLNLWQGRNELYYQLYDKLLKYNTIYFICYRHKYVINRYTHYFCSRFRSLILSQAKYVSLNFSWTLTKHFPNVRDWHYVNSNKIQRIVMCIMHNFHCKTWAFTVVYFRRLTDITMNDK